MQLDPLGASATSEGSCTWVFQTHMLTPCLRLRWTCMSAGGDVQQNPGLCSQTWSIGSGTLTWEPHRKGWTIKGCGLLTWLPLLPGLSSDSWGLEELQPSRAAWVGNSCPLVVPGNKFPSGFFFFFVLSFLVLGIEPRPSRTLGSALPLRYTQPFCFHPEPSRAFEGRASSWLYHT